MLTVEGFSAASPASSAARSAGTGFIAIVSGAGMVGGAEKLEWNQTGSDFDAEADHNKGSGTVRVGSRGAGRGKGCVCLGGGSERSLDSLGREVVGRGTSKIMAPLDLGTSKPVELQYSFVDSFGQIGAEILCEIRPDF